MNLRTASVLAPLAIAALALSIPAVASAQFTTFVAPPQKAADSAKAAVVAEARAKSDSSIRMTLGDMKAWVDSAAGVQSIVQVASADTSLIASAVAPVAAAPTTHEATTEFANGAIAPDTASTLPALLMAGFLSIGVGLLLAAGRKRRV